MRKEPRFFTIMLISFPRMMMMISSSTSRQHWALQLKLNRKKLHLRREPTRDRETNHPALHRILMHLRRKPAAVAATMRNGAD